MRKLLSTILVAVFLFGTLNLQAADETPEKTEATDSSSAATDSVPVEEAAPVKTEGVEKAPVEVKQTTKGTSEIIKDKFIEGGVGFMSIVLICLILGLAIAIERIIALNLATTNTKKLLEKTQQALRNGGVSEAKRVVSTTPGPVASIFAQGLVRIKEGIESVEKSILGYGSVEMGKLERGLTWISLFIVLAPLFGFMGTVIGMIGAFDNIEAAKTIEIDGIAGDIKVALLTTVGGLVVAVILQVFYNYCVSKIDAIVNDMDEASILFVDMLIAEEVIGTDKKA